MLSDWKVEITKIVAEPNTAANPYTGEPIDPDGLTMARFEMTLTHLPTGKVLKRSDRHSTLSVAALQQYAAGVIAVADQTIAIVADPPIGELSLAPAPAKEPTPDEKAVQAYQRVEAAYRSLRVDVDNGDVPEDDAVLLKAKAARDAAYVPVLAAKKAAIDTQVSAADAVDVVK